MRPIPRIRRRDPAPAIPGCESLHPVLRRIYASRGLATFEQTTPRLTNLIAPHQLGGLDTAVALLREAIEKNARILVIGDFDADGATGTAVAVRGLRLLGARHVDFRIPHRIRHGYGLSPELVADFGDARPELLVTVDSGIACLRGVAAAQAAGIRVIVTDHHLPGAQLPAADAIVNPNLSGDPFPSKALAGVGVMFYLLLAVRAAMRAAQDFARRGIAEPDLSTLLDLVALGTVADMVPLDANNRVLVAAGLKRLRAGLGQPGIRALIAVAGREDHRLNAADLGYAIAPRLNAAGRLEDMALGVECLLADDPAHATALAAQLHAINAERRDLQQHMLDQADTMVQHWLDAHAGLLPNGIAVFEPDWHPGVIGLVASRLKDSLHRPVIAFAPGGDDGLLRGSARSIRGFHIRDALANLAAREPDLIVRFGGHAMAAGLSLAPANLERFIHAFVALADDTLDAAMLEAELLTDGALPRHDLTRALAEHLRNAGPWGQAFPEPLFDDIFAIDSFKRVGSNHLKLRLVHGDGGEPIDAIHFDGWDDAPTTPRVHIAYQLELDDWRDRQGVQLLVRHRFAAV